MTVSINNNPTGLFFGTLTIELAALDFYIQPMYMVINMYFWILLIPFRIISSKLSTSEDETVYSTKTNSFQKVICGIISFILVIVSFLNVKANYQEKILTKPTTLFPVWSSINYAILCAIFVSTFWLKKIQFTSLLTLPLSPISFKVYFSTIIVTIVIFGLQMYNTFLEFFFIEAYGYDFSKSFEYYKQKAAYAFFVRSTPPNSTSVYEQMPTDEGAASVYTILTGFYLVTEVYIGQLICCASTFALFASVAINKSLEKLNLMAENGIVNRMRLLKNYFVVKEFIGLINEINGPIFLCLYSSSIPYFSRRTISSWDTGRWDCRALIAYKLMLYCTPFFVAAEADSKAKKLKGIILEMNRVDGDNSMSPVILSDQLGVNGGKFFTVSYGFLGVSASVLLSYAILVLQFNQPACINAKS